MPHRLLPIGLAMVSLVTSTAFAADLEAGGSVYARNCQACHGRAGAGDGPAARALRPAPTAFNTAAYWASKKDADVKAAIRTGRPGTSMMGFEALDDEQLTNLVAYLRSLAPAE